ncbi:ferritin-like domain-containing protein [Fulvivirga ulvae]|uniref:YciE/YciF ferroxidase family protein n=1 Tax=Fulvivirga ulvae TaxID=2904245 RepID=UPI001F2B1AD4|nr:ferritin-like domain-containing protein [Fulvivirga ulvae]UII31392.1 ferritin-like domain-containing protein [Fulvivirga ulvae]
MANKLNNLEDLFKHELKDLYSAETQILDALPKMVEKASNPDLKKAFEHHLEETKNQKQRLEEVCKKLEMDPKGETCKAMQGIIKEAQDMLKEDADPEVMDAALIAEAQRVEHYEIAGYGTVCTFAERLGYTDIKNKLAETLDEEKNADQKLSTVSKNVNAKAEASH